MMTSTQYSPVKLKAIKKALEKFFYSSGTNIAFYNASRKPEYKEFRVFCERAIRKQVMDFATEDSVRAIVDRVPKTLTKVDDTIIDTILSAILVSFTKTIKGGAATIDNFMLWAGIHGGQAWLNKAQIDLTFRLFNPEVVSKLQDRRNYLINTLDETTKDWIARVISKGVVSGKTNAEIVRDLQEQVKDMSKLRARKIVETETAHAMGMVELETAKRNGATQKKWVTSRDEKVCPICNGNEQQGFIPLHEQFVMSKTLAVPGHVFCRCYLNWNIPPDLTEEQIWIGA